MGEVFGRL